MSNYCKRMRDYFYVRLLSQKSGKGTVTEEQKQQLFEPLHQLAEISDKPLTVLEIGAGSGSNFQFYPDGTEVICVEPKGGFQSFLNDNAEAFPNVKVKEFIEGFAEDMSAVSDNSIDAVVCTLVLCSVQDMDLCANEIKRILKPEMSMYFMEHVRADENSKTYSFQRCVNPMWRVVADNCHLVRQPWEPLQKAGFEVDYELFQANYKWYGFMIRPHCAGVATKPAQL